MKRVLKVAGGAAILCLLLLALGTLVSRPFSGRVASEAMSREILLLHNPIHTDIALRLDEELRKEFQELGAAGVEIGFPQAVYLIFGWGGRAFYIETPTWSELKPMPVLKALTIDSSVMHVDLAGEIGRDLPNVRPIRISEQGYQALVAGIRASFDRRNGGVQKAAERGYGDFDAFFDATGRFNAFMGCNTWTAAMLRLAGLRTGAWTPLPQLLDLSLDLHTDQATMQSLTKK